MWPKIDRLYFQASNQVSYKKHMYRFCTDGGHSKRSSLKPLYYSLIIRGMQKEKVCGCHYNFLLKLPAIP